MSLKRSYNSTVDASSRDGTLEDLYESGQILDRASKFIGLFSPATDTPPKVLQQHPPFQKATHRILAWRLPSRQQTVQFERSTNQQNSSSKKPLIYDTGSLDDGEKYAGKKLEKLLIELDVVGTIVVARWYGGVMLGPVRFDHIVTAAKEAISKYQKSNATTNHDTPLPAKKPRTEPTENEVLTPEQEVEQKTRLIKALTDRDNNIVILRQLLAQKKTKKADPTSTISPESPLKSSSSQTSKPLPDYSAMSLTKLKQLDKARDTTISWILKQIDEAEGLQAPTSSIAEASEQQKGGRI